MPVSLMINADTARLEGLRQYYRDKMKALTQMKTPLAMIATCLQQSIAANFRTQSSGIAPWVKLSRFTKFIKKYRKGKRETNPKILQDSGFLRNSIIPEVGENFAKAGTNVKYARLMNNGGVSVSNSVRIGKFSRQLPKTYKGKGISSARIKARRESPIVDVKEFTMNIKGGHKIPARPFMTIRREYKTRIFKICETWFFKGGTSGNS